jgi:hypothetical protein
MNVMVSDEFSPGTPPPAYHGEGRRVGRFSRLAFDAGYRRHRLARVRSAQRKFSVAHGKESGCVELEAVRDGFSRDSGLGLLVPTGDAAASYREGRHRLNKESPRPTARMNELLRCAAITASGGGAADEA